MSKEIATYSGLNLLPAARALLERVQGYASVVEVRPVERQGITGSWTEDEVTIDWARLRDPRHSSTDLRLVGFARSMLDGSPCSTRSICARPSGDGRERRRSSAPAGAVRWM